MKTVAQYRTLVQADESVLQALQRESLLPESVLLDAATKGAVWVSLKRGKGQTRPRRLRSLDTEVSEGSGVILNYDPGLLAKDAQAMHCVSDHVNYGIWFKPAGMHCQGSKWSDHTVATQVAEGIKGKHCYLVHRLDRAASGLLLIAYTKNALRNLAAMFEKRLVIKTYQATIEGDFNHPLPLVLDAPIEGRTALTIVNHVSKDASIDCSVLTLSIESGRKHQIRRHLAELRHPIIGDRLYGQPRDNSGVQSDLQLLASHLEFKCPFTARKVSVTINADGTPMTEAAT
ncbi:MAG: RluA family pseudouridine synthase [Granulosicoccus sp.]